jgi:hypothetical protein
MKKVHDKKKRTGPRERWARRQVLIAIPGAFLVFTILTFQALDRIANDDFARNEAYYHQLVSPFVQLTAVGVFIIAGAAVGWRYWTGIRKLKKTGNEPIPERLKEPPFRWPWQ